MLVLVSMRAFVFVRMRVFEHDYVSEYVYVRARVRIGHSVDCVKNQQMISASRE